MSGRRSVGDPEYLTRRIPQNPKYQHIKTRLDTGNSLTKYTEKLEEIKRRLTRAEAPSPFPFFDVASPVAEAQRRTSLNQSDYSFRAVLRITMSENPNGPSRTEPDYRYKKDELFKRLKVTTFAQLAIQVASLSDETLEVTNEEIQKLEDGDSATPDADAELTAGTNGKGSPREAPLNPLLFINNTGAGESYRSTLQSVISGVGELDIEKDTPKKVDPQAKDMPYPDCPFLLLDVRDRDAYDQCHIVGAHSYPIATLSRTMNPYTNSILEYKNAHGKIIILYDDDERIASQAATTMCERGFENLFMLSGGLKVLAQKIPEGLVTGSLPASCQVATHTGSAQRKATPKVSPTRAENKWRFTADDLQKMKYYLEEEQIPLDTASRLSRGSSGRDSKATTVRSNHSLPGAPGSAGSLTARSLSSGSLQNRPWK